MGENPGSLKLHTSADDDMLSFPSTPPPPTPPTLSHRSVLCICVLAPTPRFIPLGAPSSFPLARVCRRYVATEIIEHVTQRERNRTQILMFGLLEDVEQAVWR